MDSKIKMALITLGSLAVVGGLGYLISKQIKKSKKQQEEIEKKEKKEKENLKVIEEGQQQLQGVKEGDKVKPIRNIDKGINNSFGDIKGVKLYPARKSADPQQGHTEALGYTNVREDAVVDNEKGFSDLWMDNLLGKVEGGGKLIGTIVAEKYDDLSPPMRWFKVKIDSGVKKQLNNAQYGWVRADTVTFRTFSKKKNTNKSKPKKKSSFGGDMVERYNTSYQLGAEVFPHSGWNIQSNRVNADLFDNFDAKQLDLNL